MLKDKSSLECMTSIVGTVQIFLRISNVVGYTKLYYDCLTLT